MTNRRGRDARSFCLYTRGQSIRAGCTIVIVVGALRTVIIDAVVMGQPRSNRLQLGYVNRIGVFCTRSHVDDTAFITR
ncbi:hypothetical protein D3C76_1244330 [compost metagenome]